MDTVLTEENTKMNLHVLDFVVEIVRDDQKEEITHLHKVKHIRIHEAI